MFLVAEHWTLFCFFSEYWLWKRKSALFKATGNCELYNKTWSFIHKKSQWLKFNCKNSLNVMIGAIFKRGSLLEYQTLLSASYISLLCFRYRRMCWQYEHVSRIWTILLEHGRIIQMHVQGKLLYGEQCMQRR